MTCWKLVPSAVGWKMSTFDHLLPTLTRNNSGSEFLPWQTPIINHQSARWDFMYKICVSPGRATSVNGNVTSRPETPTGASRLLYPSAISEIFSMQITSETGIRNDPAEAEDGRRRVLVPGTPTRSTRRWRRPVTHTRFSNGGLPRVSCAFPPPS